MTTKNDYYRQGVDEVTDNLKTSTKTGLSQEEVKKRLAETGPNEFEKKKKKSTFQKFLNQFKSFMIIVLLVAAAISGVIGYLHGEGFTDAIIILAIVILNAIIGTVQEAKAEESLEALEKMAAPHCTVMRDGKIQEIASRDLVPGDIVILETGDSVPADIRLTSSVNLKVQEAALTGESVPTEKNIETINEDMPIGDRHNMVFSSSTITYGRGEGVVVATGMKTEVGKIASMLQSVPETKTPLQKRLDSLGKFLGIGAIIICALIFIIGILHGKDILTMFMTAISLAAAAIPEGLPAVSTIVLAVGVQRLVKKNAIVRTLPSVETLGSTTVICSDKTGTLTQNKMTVVKIYTNGNTDTVESLTQNLSPAQKQVIQIAMLANDSKISDENGIVTVLGDPTETALIDLGGKFGMAKTQLDIENPRVEELPFDSERKLMTTIHQIDKQTFLYCTKGGVDELLACCDKIHINGEVRALAESDKENIRQANLSMAEDALRVLAMAYKTIDKVSSDPGSIESELIYTGMVGMIDPPRPEVKDAVEKCRQAGIKPVMITGDHKITAVAIGKELGIYQDGDVALLGSDLEKMSDSELAERIHEVSIYARVAPEHKVRIVEAFQKRGDIVAMTGDGVNDAPALKLADIGCAMGITGTDVSKEAADIILTDDNFATVVTAVEEGRRIYDNILKAIQFMISTNIGEILVLFIAVLFGWDSPLLPIHILWINLVTDSLPALALSVDPASQGIMSRQPVKKGKNMMSGPFATRIFLQGGMIGILSLVAFIIGMQTNLATAQTMTFAVLAFTQMTHIFNVRTEWQTAFKQMFSNAYLLGAIVIVNILMLSVLFIPALHGLFHIASLSMTHWWWIIGLSLSPLVIVEIIKGIGRLSGKK